MWRPRFDAWSGKFPHAMGPLSPQGWCAQSCPTLCNPMDCRPPGSSVHGIFQAIILEWVAISYSRGSSQPRDWTYVSSISCLSRRILYHCATWEAHGRPGAAKKKKKKKKTTQFIILKKKIWWTWFLLSAKLHTYRYLELNYNYSNCPGVFSSLEKPALLQGYRVINNCALLSCSSL